MTDDKSKIKVSKAQSLSPKCDDIPEMVIIAEKVFPEYTNMAEARFWHGQDAKKIADALFASLPGGTIDALIVEMLDRKRSVLRVVI